MDTLVKLMILEEFFRILKEEGEDAAIEFAEDFTGEKIHDEDEQKERPSLHIVDGDDN